MEGVFFGGIKSGGKSFRPLEMLAFATIIVFLTFLGSGIRFSRWGKNSLGGVKIHHVATGEKVKCVGSDF